MKHIVLFIFLIFYSLNLNAQIPIELSIQGRGSDINGLLGAELQIGNYGLYQGWRPMGNNVHSYVGTFSKYFNKNEFFQAYPYISLGYSSNGKAYSETFALKYYDKNNIHYKPAIFMLFGMKSDITKSLYGKAGLGLTLSNYGQPVFSFELSINYALFKNKKHE